MCRFWPAYWIKLDFDDRMPVGRIASTSFACATRLLCDVGCKYGDRPLGQLFWLGRAGGPSLLVLRDGDSKRRGVVGSRVASDWLGGYKTDPEARFFRLIVLLVQVPRDWRYRPTMLLPVRRNRLGP